MPQFDTFIFSSNLFYFMIALFIVFVVNYIIPKYGALLKLRVKIFINTISIGVLLFFILFFNINLGLIDILSLYVDDQDSFGLIVITISVIAFTEFIYYKFNGHHSYLFANMLAGHNYNFIISVPLITLPQDYSSLPYYLSFDIFSPLVTSFYIFSFFAALVVPYLFYIISRYIIDKQYRKRFIITFVLASIIFFTIPLTLLITSIITCIPSIFFYLHYKFKHRFFNNLFSLIVSFLNRHGILQFLLKLHTRLFHEISDYQFVFLINNLFIFSLAYTIISRFYIFFVVTNNLSLFSLNNILLLNVTLFLCLFIWSFRIIVNLSFFIGSSRQSFIHLFGEDIPPSSPQPNPSSIPPSSNPQPPIRQFSFWNRHTYYNYNSFARPRWYYMGNLTLGTCTFLLGCVGTYIGYQVWQTSIDSNRATDKNTDAINRQSDQADLDSGRMSEKEYMDKWSTNSDYVKLSDSEKLKLLDQWKRERKNKE
jgi:hypothetical protein